MKIIVSGFSGHMGQILASVIEKREDMELSGGICIDADTVKTDLCPVFSTPSECLVDSDILIDFSNHFLTLPLLEYCVERNLPAVICTTGQTAQEKEAILSAAGRIPIFFSANMSVGIAVLIRMAKEAAVAFPDADIEIVETHHNRKLDVPSGTALMIADGLKQVRKDADLCVGRHEAGKRKSNEIGIHSIRLGNEIGTHEVIIATKSQVLTLKHEARDRALFAEGAIAAAEFLFGKEPGLYGMKDLITSGQNDKK